MQFSITDLAGLLIYEPTVHADSRGHFFESYNLNVFHNQGIDIKFVQDNQSFSQFGVIRGLHYQLLPHAQTKLVRVLSGRIYDVAVDIRRDSRTFGKHFGVELSAENRKQLLIPHGFAHGFSVLSEKAEVMYKCDAFYHKASEGGIRWDDATLNIDWRVSSADAIVSEKDKELPVFENVHTNF